MKRILAGCLLWAVVSVPVVAQTDNDPIRNVGKDAVWTGRENICNNVKDNQAWLDCLVAEGLDAPAMAFATSALDPQNIGERAILIGFEEAGQVDIGRVLLPYQANTNIQTVFLNGDVGIEYSWKLSGWDVPSDVGTRRLLARHPEARPSGRTSISGHRLLGDGRQRFVVTDIVTDGCRGCAVVALSINFVEFQNGRLAGNRPVGWIRWSLSAEDNDPAANLARLVRGDVVQLQKSLNLAGYDAGSMDGAIGPQTRAALADFQKEHCITSGTPLDAAQASLLLKVTGSSVSSPCAAAKLRELPTTNNGFEILGQRTEDEFRGALDLQVAQPVHVVVFRDEAGFRIRYPELACVGALVLREDLIDRMFLEEQIESGAEICGSGGWVTLTRRDDGGIGFSWAEQKSGDVAYSAVLKARTPPPTLDPSATPANRPDEDSLPLVRDGPDLIMRLQQELARLGCNPGVADGTWGPRSQAALDAWGVQTGVVDLARTPTLLSQLEAQSDRVCPLSCGPGQLLVEGACVEISCPPGRVLNNTGSCVTPRRACFVFNGKQVCG